jgi:hypothetical protein
MKKYLYLLAICSIAAASCSDNSAAEKTAEGTTANGVKSLTTMKWIDSVQNYGNIKEGQKLAVSFRFRNTGSKPLIIESVAPSCGCTVADYPKEPIAPGGEGEITGEFDSNGREGLQHKEITVKANTPDISNNVYFEVNVLPNADKNASGN